MERAPTWPAALEAHELSRQPGVAGLLVALRGRSGCVALDSVAGSPRRWSWVACEPRVEISESSLEFSDLRRWCAKGSCATDIPGPFAGGFLGALAYDLGVAGETQNLPADPWSTPAVLGGLYAEFFVIDHQAGRAWFVSGDDFRGARRAELIELAESAGMDEPRDFEQVSALRRLVSREEHMARIERTREWILAGEFYQANLAHPLEADTRGDPLDLYLALRQRNPAPYAAFLGGKDFALISSSPELLLEVCGAEARTQPIKGTRERSPNPIEDQRRAQELCASEKDRAELAMIVDLERNDLGRVARTGSVRVDEFQALRSFENVHHLTADVCCRLAEGRDGVDALAALFPGGSISGAPKLRAMQAICDLEGEGRGFFTGSMGFVSCGGDLAFNILIRTLLWRRTGTASEGQVRFHVGGGITWSSDPAAEDDETLAKGERLAAALMGLPKEVRS
ncbi:MAG: anthranilate synthase component I family protein [bacterium]|jgi:para-aminobenzoate synthetase component 1